jgi:RNA polymerase sigma factor (sigma-70 family)
MGLSRGRRSDAEEEVLRLVSENAANLLRFARRFSLCADDAQDAYQRALEILLRRMHDEPPENPLSWLRTVLRHEAGAVREQRLRDVGPEEPDFDRHESRQFADPADRAERFEGLAHAAEALRRLKPQEVTALALRAEGLSYREICARTGWSYTRCNRAISEGRRALIARMKAIETGAECEQWLPLLSLLADGEASARDLAELRPHLRSCVACRATLRDFHDAPRQVGALVPAALLPLTVAGAGGGGAGLGLGRHLEALAHTLSERLAVGAMRMQGAIDALPATTKVAAVAASTAAIAGGGAAIDQVATWSNEQPRPAASHVIATGAPASGGALTTIPASAPSVRLPTPEPGADPAGGRASRVPSVNWSLSGVGGEFGFEAGAAGREAARAHDRTGLARAAAARATPRRAAPSRPPEFASQPAATAVPAGETTPPSAVVPPPSSAPEPSTPAPSAAPATSAPAEFAGP